MESDSVCNHTSDYKIVGVRFVNHEYDYRPTTDDTKSTYQLIIKITIREAQEMKILVGNIGFQITDNFENN